MRTKPRRAAHQGQLPLAAEPRPPAIPADRTKEVTAAQAELLLGVARMATEAPVKGGDDEHQDHD